MKELQDLVNNKFEEIINSGEIEKTIENSLQKTIVHSITSQLERYGDFSKAMNELIKKSLQFDIEQVEVPVFTTVMTDVVGHEINKFFESQAAEKFTQMVKEKIAPLPQEISIVDFVEKIVSYWRSDDPCGCNDDMDDYATVEFESRGYSSLPTLYELKIWKQKESGYSYKTERSPDVRVTIDTRDGTIQGCHKSIYYIFDEQAYIFKAYAQSVKLTGLEDFEPEEQCELRLTYEHY